MKITAIISMLTISLFSSPLFAENNNPPPGNNGQPFLILQGEVEALTGRVSEIETNIISDIDDLKNQISNLQTQIQQISLPSKASNAHPEII